MKFTPAVVRRSGRAAFASRDLCSVFGYCFPNDEFPVERHNLKHGKQCFVDRECASQECNIDGTTAYGRAGECR